MRGSIVGLLAAAACSPEYGISTLSGPTPAPSEPLRAEAPAAAPPVIGRETRLPDPDFGVSSAARRPAVRRPAARTPPKQKTVVLGGGERTATADFLFVVDGSSSMEAVIGSVRAGIEALVAEGAFPADARLAVMSTLPADPSEPAMPHPAVPERLLARSVWDPGFLGPVDADRITRLKRHDARLGARFPMPGCDAWFTPDQRDADGVPCLVAHTQTTMTPVMVEAGLTALGQRLASGEPLFRSGAAVNVVFVSDTHDPGLPASHPRFADLVSLRPTGEELALLAVDTHELASFRLHAIAPARKCSPESWTAIGPVYFDAAAATGGRTLDVCDARPEDYVELIRAVATDGAIPTRPVVALGEAAEVDEVLVDGVPTGFAVSADGRAVLLDGAVPARRAAVEVRYRARPVVPVSRTGPGR